MKAADIRSASPLFAKRFNISDGSLEGLKWLALALMTLDHVNKYLFAYKLPVAFELGRISMPLFVLVLAYNLARPGSTGLGRYLRVSARLLAGGLVACLPYVGMGSLLLGWWPLNIMFTLAVMTLTIGLLEHGGKPQTGLATLLFALGGLVVEYWWPALAFGLLGWLYFKKATSVRLLGVLLALFSLYLINKNHWALMAVPIFWLASTVTLKLPRMSKLFYVYYPAHLFALWALQQL